MMEKGKDIMKVQSFGWSDGQSGIRRTQESGYEEETTVGFSSLKFGA